MIAAHMKWQCAIENGCLDFPRNVRTRNDFNLSACVAACKHYDLLKIKCLQMQKREILKATCCCLLTATRDSRNIEIAAPDCVVVVVVVVVASCKSLIVNSQLS